MGFAGTKRNLYTQVKIQKMRSERKTKKAKVDGVPDSSYIRSMGDLIGAGHLKFVGVSNVNIKTEDIVLPHPEKMIKKTEWNSLSIPKNKSNEYNADKFSKEKTNKQIVLKTKRKYKFIISNLIFN